jgi:phage shock protein A
MRLFIALTLVHAYSLGAGMTPVQKVVAMLQDMKAKGTEEKQSEQVRFAAYKEFCENTEAEKKDNIAAANEEIEQLQADILKAESDAAVLASDIAKLDADIAQWENDKASATAIHKKDKADYEGTHKDYTASIDQLIRAIEVLKAQDVERPQTAMLLQKVASLKRMPEDKKKKLMSFLATDSEIAVSNSLSHKQTPKGYEFQSGGLVEMLTDMKEKFEDELNALEKEFLGTVHAYEMMTMELKDSIATADKTRTEKAKMKASREEAAASAKVDLTDTIASRDEDKAYLSALQAQCTQKSDDFEERQQLRSEELEAIEKAIEIVASKSLAGNAEKHITGGYSAGSFALRGKETASPVQRQVAAYLQERGHTLQSRALSALSIRVGTNPFGEVKKLIDDMITKLLEEANEESNHKGWCDTEMAKSTHTRESKTEEIDALKAKIDQLDSAISTLAQDISDLNTQLSEISKSVAEALEVRAKEHAKNKETIEDSEAAQTATSQALSVLKDFYAKAATATALIQAPEIDAPDTFDGPYTGMASGGVVGLLEVVASDFARLEAETTAAEENAVTAHGRFMAESAKDTAVKNADLAHKGKSKVAKESDLADTKTDMAGTQQELDAALVYYEKLKPSCQDATVTYDDRVSKREEEIKSLKQALQILSD